MANFLIEKLKRLPRNPTEIWQGGIVELPMPEGIELDEDDDGQPVVAVVWRSATSDAAHFGEPFAQDEAPSDVLWREFAAFATNPERAGFLPGKVEVLHGEAEALRPLFEQVGVEIEGVDELAAVDEALDFMRRQIDNMSGSMIMPIVSGAGVTVSAVKRFAEAASEFYDAEVWKKLAPEDLIAIESPRPLSAMKYVVVLGAGGIEHGLGFYDNPAGHQATMRGELPVNDDPETPIWSMMFYDVDQASPVDVELWKQQKLPFVGPEQQIPVPVSYHPDLPVGDRPDAARLAFIEGLLRALGTSSEAQIDTGRWTVSVETSGGPMSVTLALPALLKKGGKPKGGKSGKPNPGSKAQMLAELAKFISEQGTEDADQLNRLIAQKFGNGIPKSPRNTAPSTPAERAQQLCFEANETDGRRRVQMLKEALKLDPDCVEAYVMLADFSADAVDAARLYQQGVDAGERMLGDRLERDAGHFWGLVETRPYMRALFGLAQVYTHIGDKDSLSKAADMLAKLLRLNPSDNQGVRYLYPSVLMALDRDADAARFMKTQENEEGATWLYARAILAFRLGGDCDAAREELRAAVKENKYVPAMLSLEPEERPPVPPSYEPGTLDEAVIVIQDLLLALEATPDAWDWIEAIGPSLAPTREPKTYKTRKRKK